MKPTMKSLVPYYKEIDLTQREVWRAYRFPGGEVVRIDKPAILIISDNGHRLVDQAGMSHYVPYGWLHLYWENPEGRTEGFFCRETPESQASRVKEPPSDA